MFNDQSIPTLVGLIVHEAGNQTAESLLWAADEHLIDEPCLRPLKSLPIQFVSNRLDQFRKAEQAGLNAFFSDFSFDSISDVTDSKVVTQVFFRVAKERALVHHLINQAFLHLPIGGTLWLAGHKNEGIKTHIARAASLFGSKARVRKGKNQLSLASITKQNKTGALLQDQDYPLLRQTQLEDQRHYWTKPGVYGWDKIDSGSLFLHEVITEKLKNLDGLDVLDLGCGYGYLSTALAKLQPQSITATDNCAAAIAAADRNLQDLHLQNPGIPCSLVASDAGDCIEASFDLIVCNPPFHLGFSTSDELHNRFLINTKRLLKPKGQAWYVVNQFLPIEKHCTRAGLKCKQVARNNSYRVICISK